MRGGPLCSYSLGLFLSFSLSLSHSAETFRRIEPRKYGGDHQRDSRRASRLSLLLDNFVCDFSPLGQKLLMSRLIDSSKRLRSAAVIFLFSLAEGWIEGEIFFGSLVRGVCSVSRSRTFFVCAENLRGYFRQQHGEFDGEAYSGGSRILRNVGRKIAVCRAKGALYARS